MYTNDVIQDKNTVISHNIFNYYESYHGHTVVAVPDADNKNIVNIGVAICSAKDQYSKKIGRETALQHINEGKFIPFFTPYDINTQRKDFFRDVRNYILYGDLETKYMDVFAKPKGNKNG